jgi:membrane-associated protein
LCRLCDDAAVVAAVFDQFRDWVSGRWWSYLAIFAVSAIDAFFPLVPSETVVITAGNLASSGDLVLPLVILSAAAGAVAGDNISYFIGKWAGERTVRRLFRSEKAHRGFDWAEEQLERRGFYIIVIARFIPGGRTAVTFTSGYTQGMPWRKFIVADVVAGLVWATYATMLGYIGGKQFEEQPWKGLLFGFAIALGVALLVEAIRHYRSRQRPA